MKAASLALLVARDLRRARGALAAAGFGIIAGTAALFFFLSLGLGVRSVLLGSVFPLDKIELEPAAKADPGLLALVLGSSPMPGIPGDVVDQVRAWPELVRVYPKLKFAFPSTARGGAEVFGQDIGTSEMLGDGVDPALVEADVKPPWRFEDTWESGGPSCRSDDACASPKYCERASTETEGKCVDPVPVLVSRYLVEIFNKGVAPAHGLPPVGESLISRANGVTFNLRLGESLLGRAKLGAPRTVRARVVGVSSRAIDLGMTLPLPTIRRWNKEYAGEQAANSFSSLLVEVKSPGDAGQVIARASKTGLVPHDTRARDVSVLIDGILALLTLVATVILLVSASNIAYTFRALLHERRATIGLYRAVGATRLDIEAWVLSLAAVVGAVCGSIGLAIGWMAAFVADHVASARLPDFPFKPESFFAYPWWLVCGAVVFGALFAIVGAIGPARAAAKVDPREALLQGG
ncbi:MAG: ABC transporter permease [Deltaproteobacteria bacterium]|nr:ABC transporter permease [Deltaproteobacteria bacterium]